MAKLRKYLKCQGKFNHAASTFSLQNSIPAPNRIGTSQQWQVAVLIMFQDEVLFGSHATDL